MSWTRAAIALATGTLALSSLAACAQEAPPGAPGPSGASATSNPAGSCAKDVLPLKKPGTLSLATDNPAYEPWFADNTPKNGRGYESAVAYAVADRLGFAKDEVAWSFVGFNQAIAPGEKAFDAAINQFSISDERRKAVDFSTPYYVATQAVVTQEGSPIAGATSIAQLKNASLGAQVGTTSHRAITEQIAPTRAPKVFDTNDLAVQALKNGQVDGIVVDLPTAFYMANAQLDKGKIVGQLPVTGQGDEFGFLLTKGSPLTPCLSQAVDALRADGTLARLADQWLTASGAPALS